MNRSFRASFDIWRIAAICATFTAATWLEPVFGEEITGGIWSAQLHKPNKVFSVKGSFSRRNSEVILDTFIAAGIGQPGHYRSITLLGTLDAEGSPAAGLGIGCKHWVPRGRDPECAVTANVPFKISYGNHIGITLEEQPSIDLTRYLEAFTRPTVEEGGESFTYVIGDDGRVSLNCKRQSRQHIPSCHASIENRFESYNFYEPGYPDPIELPSDGHVLVQATTMGDPVSSVAQSFQALLPLLPFEEGDSPGRLVHELFLDGDEYGSNIWCSQYRTRPESYAIRNCLLDIQSLSVPRGSISIPLDIKVVLEEAASAILRRRLDGRNVSGFLTEVDSSDILAPFIGPVRPWMSLSCPPASSCVLHLTHNRLTR